MTGKSFTGSASDWGRFGRGVTGDLVGVNPLVESIYGFDISKKNQDQPMDGWERARRAAGGVGALAGTAAGGISLAAKYPTLFPIAAKLTGVPPAGVYVPKKPNAPSSNAGLSAERIAADAAKARTYPYRPDTPTTHAMERMVTRGVSWDSVQEAVRNGVRTFDPQTGVATYKLPASLSSTGRGVNVVRNEITGKIITVIDKGSR